MISPDEDFAGAPLLRTEARARPRTRRRRRGHAARHRARRVRPRRINGSPVADDVLSPAGAATSGGCATAATTSPTCSQERRERRRARPPARQRVVPRPARLGRRPRATTARSSGPWPSWRSCSPTGTARWSAPTRAGRRARPTSRERPVRRRDDRRPAAGRRLAAAGLRRRRVGRGPRPRGLRPRVLTPYIGPPVRRQEEIRPVRIWTSPAGQDARRLRAEPGRLAARSPCHGEPRLDDHHPARRGARERRARRPAAAHREGDRPIHALSGGEDVFEPTLTFHGFRYAEVDGWPGELERSDAPRRRRRPLRPAPHRLVRCSDELLNQLHRNVVWGAARQLPRRPHRLPAARRAARLDRRHRRVRADRRVPVRRRRLPARLARRPRRRAAGRRRAWSPFVVPDVLKYTEYPTDFPAPESTAIWSDAAVWVPWALWQAYGDPTCSPRPTTR